MTNIETLKINPVKLNEASVKGLLPIQVESMKNTALEVNQAMAVAGQATRAAMSSLALLKRNVGHKNWTAFIKSGVLSVSAKKAADYVNSFDKWLATDTDVSDEILGSLSARSMAAIANTNPEVRTIVKAKVLAGGSSESDIRKVIAEVTGDKKKGKKYSAMETLEAEQSKGSSASKEDLLKSVEVLQYELKAKQGQIADLKKENEKLKAELFQLKETGE